MVSRLLPLLVAVSVLAAEHKIKPGDDPQAALDAAAPGDKLTFLPGLHQHGLQKTFKEPESDEPAYASVKRVFTSSAQEVVDRLLFR
ncbi:hypothetical protein EBR16_01855, partial [bacterium]|nr:hypothetical protein [bacterium]